MKPLDSEFNRESKLQIRMNRLTTDNDVNNGHMLPINIHIHDLNVNKSEWVSLDKLLKTPNSTRYINAKLEKVIGTL